jgi:hypothetical protein
MDAPSPAFIKMKVDVGTQTIIHDVADMATQTTTLEASRLTLANIQQNLAMKPHVKLDDERDLKIPRLLLLDKKPSTTKNQCPIENMVYREVDLNGEKLYFIVTKNWNVEIYKQKKSSYTQEGKFAFLVPARRRCLDKT